MLSYLRTFAKSPFATLLLGVLVVSFGIWGIRDVFTHTGPSDAVVKAGARPPVTSAQFKEIFDQERSRREQQAGQPLSVEDAVKYGMDKGLTDALAGAEASAALMVAEGINPSDQLIVSEISKIQAFFNPITGQFDKDTYKRALAERHITEQEADSQFRDTVIQRHYITGMAAGLKAPRIYGLVQAAFQREGRDFAWFAVTPAMVEQPPAPTDAQLNDFIKQNAAQLTKPEMRVLSLVHFSAVNLAQTLPAPETEVKNRFDFEKDSLSTPEKRTVIEIAVKDAKIGQAVADKLKSGGDPIAIAHAAGGEATTFPATPKTAIPDKKVAEAAFGLKAGEVAGPLQGDLGLAVIKVVDIAPAKVATLDDARAKIEGEVKQQAAKEKIYEVVQKYEDAHSGGADMAAAAKTAGIEVNTLPPLLASGATLAGQRSTLPPKVLQAAFSLPSGGESDAIDLGQGEYWVVHVNQVLPPTLVTLDEMVGTTNIRDTITKQFIIRQLFTKLKVKADALMAEIKGGKTLEAVAAEVGAKVTQAADVNRNAAQPAQPGQPPAYSSDLLGQLFQAKVGDVVQGEDTKPGLIIAKLEKVDEAAPPILAGLAMAGDQATTRALYQDIDNATRIAAQHKIKPVVDYKQARKALGLDPTTAPAPAAPAGGKPPAS